MADNIPVFGIAETDDYVRKILGRAGPLPKGKTNRELAAFLLPHLIHQESRGNHAAVSPVGARGVTQVMPKTGQDPGFGVAPLKDDSRAEYERFGLDYLTAMLDRYKGRADLALAAYNAGPVRADKWATRGGTKPSGSLYRASAGIEAVTPLASPWGDLPTAQSAPGGRNFFSNVVGRDSSIAAIDRLIEDSGYARDPSFRVADLSDKEWKDLTDGIPEEYHEGLGNAVSRAHLQTLADRTRAAVRAEEELAGYGGWGLAGRFALNVLDPASLAIGFMSGGLGIATKAKRLAYAARAARNAGNFAEGAAAVRSLEALAGTSRGAEMARSALHAGIVNAAFVSAISVGDTTRDGWDVALAGLTGSALGAGISRVFGGRELRRVQVAFIREREGLVLAEARAAARARMVELQGRLERLDVETGVKDAQDALDALQGELPGLAQARRERLTEASQGVLKRSERAALRREVKRLRKQFAKSSNLVNEVEARMLSEDIAAMGPREAATKQRAKMRRRAAEKEAKATQDNLAARLASAEDRYSKATKADEALTELRRVERREKQGDHLGMLSEGGRAAFGAKQAEATARLTEVLGIRDARKAEIEAEIQAVNDGTAAITRASDERLAAEAADAFGEDSGGAARFMGFNEGIHPELDGKDFDSGLPAVGQMRLAGAVRKGPLATFSGILRGSDNATVRNLLGRMVGNVLGNKDGSASVIGASEHASRIHESMTAKFYSAVSEPYKKWAQEKGYGVVDRRTRKVREEYMGLVGRAIRTPGPPDDPALAGVVEKVRAIFKDYLLQAKEAGVKGFENVEPNDTYLPRVFDFNALRNIEDRIGSDNLRLLVQKAIQEQYKAEEPDVPAAVEAFTTHGEERTFQLKDGSEVTIRVDSKMTGEPGEEVRLHAYVDGEEAGHMYYFKGHGDLNVAVPEKFRRRGIATILYDAAEAGGADIKGRSNALSISPEAEAVRAYREARGTNSATSRKPKPKGLDDATAAKIAAAYVKRMKELRVGSDAGLMQGVKWDDVGFLRRFLDEAGVPKDEVDDVVNKFAELNARRERQTEGSFRNAKHRVQFDENFSLKFRDQWAAKEGRIEDIEVKMSDLLENNVEALFGRYTRTVSGHIGLAKVGIKSKSDFEAAIQAVERELGDSAPDELKRVKETADVAYKLITGQPIENSTALTRLGRAVRDWNFTTTMNQAGWAQAPDLAGLLSKGYLKYTLSNFFGAKLFRRTDGSLDDVFSRELEEWIGVGTDFHNNAVFSSFDPGEEVGLSGILGKFEHGVRVAGRGTQVISGMAWITSFAQRMAARGITQRLMDDALKGGAFSAERRASLGLDAAMSKRIAKQIKEHTEFVNGDFGGKVRVVNWSKWTDIEARDAMLGAVHREARRLVQEEDLGDTTKWMHTNLGKLMIQFRRFAMVSYTRQVLHGVAHADAEAATQFLISTALAAMAYKARHETALALKAAGGMSEDDQRKYREKYLTGDRLAAAAWANSSFSAFAPMLVDTAAYHTAGERLFNTRTSGLGSDFFSGIPAVAKGRDLSQAFSGIAQAVNRGDRQFDQNDAAAIRRLLPFQNALGMDVPFGAMTEGLPDKDVDNDPNAIDWGFQN